MAGRARTGSLLALAAAGATARGRIGRPRRGSGHLGAPEAGFRPRPVGARIVRAPSACVPRPRRRWQQRSAASAAEGDLPEHVGEEQPPGRANPGDPGGPRRGRRRGLLRRRCHRLRVLRGHRAAPDTPPRRARRRRQCGGGARPVAAGALDVASRPARRCAWAVGVHDPDGHLCIVRTSIGFDFVLDGEPGSTYSPLREAAERYNARGASVLVPSATDALLTTCVMGARRGPIPNVQWIADAVMILRSAGDRVDWERLVRLGSERGQTLRLRQALPRISSFPGTSVPPSVTERLSAERVAWREQVVYACASGAFRGPGALPRHVAEHLVATSERYRGQPS